MTIPISKMAAAVQPSATLAAGAKARQLRAEGVHVFDFSLGEPDFLTPEHICQAATKAMRDGHTHYTPAAGIAELRSAVARLYQKTQGLQVAAEQVIVSNGAKHSLHNALAATVGPGDEVVIPTPYWVSYSDLVQMTGATSVLVRTTHESGFKMTPEQLRAALSPRSRLVMLNSPCNPTGTVYTRRELEARRDLVCKRLAAMPGVLCPVPGGAFYAFFNVAAHFGRTLSGRKVTDSATFCQAALETAHVNLVPGAAFGAEGYVRLSFAASREELNGGLDQLEKLLRTAG